jgi:D-lactate dehydrogenase
MYNKASIMALLYFYDATELDREQISNGLKETDHHWEYVTDKISLDNIHPEAEVISVFVTSKITKEIIEALPKLKLIACRSTGYNNIDMTAVEEHQITVVNVPTYGEDTVSEYAFALLLSLMRKLNKVLDAEAEDIDMGQMTGHDLAHKTIGIIGGGHIGQHTIKIANGFSMDVLVYDAIPNKKLEKKLGFTYVTLEDLLSKSDVISLHAPYLPSTHHILNEAAFSQIKVGAILINTARGELVDTAALTDALLSGRLGGAAIDVIEGEGMLHLNEEEALLRSQVPSSMLRHSLEISILKKLPNVIISPHNAFNTIEAIERINNTTTQNIIDFWYNNVPNKVLPKQSFGKLILARHAESEWNATGQWSGITDVHLTDKGFHEAVLMARALQSLAVPVDIAYCSQQIRTRETLEGMLNASQQFDVDIIPEAAINERDYGDYTGKNKWEMKDLLGEDEFNAIRRGWDVPVPNGETLKHVYERVLPFYANIVLPLLEQGKNVLLVGHGNSIRSLIKYLENIDDEGISELEMLFGEILVYDIDSDGHMISKISSKIDSPPPKA